MDSMMPEGIVRRISEAGIVAVLVIDDPESAPALARVLLENGIGAMELTLRTPSALESLRRIRKEVPAMFAGVGTIIDPGQVVAALEAGAEFGVSPGFNPTVVAAARKAGLPFAPGVATPSEIEGAYALGCTVLKLFPAEGMGGLEYLKSINAPYRHLGLRYIPLGGLSMANLAGYLRAEEILAIGGSWIAPQKSIASRDWATIGCNAGEAAATLRLERGSK